MWHWARRRHPNKSKRWVFDRYFQKGRPYGAAFYADTEDSRGRRRRLYLVPISTIPILRHVKVKGTASPDDPALDQYWERRRTKLGRHRFAPGSKLYG